MSKCDDMLKSYADLCRLKDKTIEQLESKLAAANKIIAEGRGQEPVAFWYECSDPNGSVLRTEYMLPSNSEGYKPLYAAPVLPPDAAELAEIAKRLHYPQCWDTAAYPTLMEALLEIAAHDGCSECKKP
jgi:hypothetical protein